MLSALVWIPMKPLRISDVDPQVLAEALLASGPAGAPEIIRQHHRDAHERALDWLDAHGQADFVREACVEAVVSPRSFNEDVPHLLERLAEVDVPEWGKAIWNAGPSRRRLELVCVSAVALEQTKVAQLFWDESRCRKGYRGFRCLYWADLSPPGKEDNVLRWLLDHNEPVAEIAQAIAGHPDPSRQAAWVESALNTQYPQLLTAMAAQSRTKAATLPMPEMQAA